MLADLIKKGRERMLQVTGAEPTAIKIPMKKDTLEWYLTNSEELQEALLGACCPIETCQLRPALIQWLGDWDWITRPKREKSPISGAITAFTDAGKKSRTAAITWQENGVWKHHILQVEAVDSLQTMELLAVRLLDRLTEEDKNRLEKKLLLILRPLLLQLKGHSKAIDRAITHRCRTTRELIDIIESLSSFHIRGPAKENCLECNSPYCAAWVALCCGGCDKTFWVDQSLLFHLWCKTCNYRHTWEHNWEWALRNQTGLDTASALNLYESHEQKILAYYRWEVQHILKRVKAQSASYIASVRCRKLVPLTQRSVVGPVRGDPNQALDNCIRRLQRCGLQVSGTVRLKTEKKKKANSKAEK
ncbi:uncharacterized protein GJ701_004829 isoform 2-T2 [Geothlypis trichas]